VLAIGRVTGYGLNADLANTLCCVGLLLYGVTGTIYGWFAHRHQEAANVGRIALGGGATTAIVSTITSVISMAIPALHTQGVTPAEGITYLVNSRTASEAMLMGISCLGNLITQLIFPAGFGASGAAIYAAIAKRRQLNGATPRGDVRKLNAGAMLIAFGIGLVIESVMVAIGEVMNAAAPVTAGALPEPILLSRAVETGLFLSCFVYLLYGAIYAWLAHADQGAIGAGTAALGGCITAAAVAVIGLVVSVNLELWRGSYNRAISLSGGGVVGGFSGQLFVDLLFGLCIALVLSAGLGAAGGAIYVAIAGRGQPQGIPPNV
jgi:hypothetical protein